MKLQVELISKELVKPSSPTPDHLRRHHLSLIDLTSAPVFMPWLLFYPKTANATNEERCSLVKKSLLEALSVFYPLAGRFTENASYIDCNDEDVPFFQSNANCAVSDIVQHPIPSEMIKLLPYELDDTNDFAAVVLLTFFDCGGMSIGLGMSHNVGDAFSMFVFLNSWTAIARGDKNDDMFIPCFDSAALFPPRSLGAYQPSGAIIKENLVAKRFVFDGSTIAALSSKYSEERNKELHSITTHPPTRVEALSAFICSRFKAVTEGEPNSDKIRYVAYQLVNLRSRMDPPLSNKHFGNFYGISPTDFLPNMDADDDGCRSFINQIRAAIRNINTDYLKTLQQGGDEHLVFMKEMNDSFRTAQAIMFTSLCRFPVREADFGWGKPIWVGLVTLTLKNSVTFLDTEGGDGIEAFINLKEEDMVKLETNSEFVAHVYPV